MERSIHSPYRPLESSKREFRLLRLLDSEPDHVRGEFRVSSLDDNDLPRWKALSYRWGEDDPVSEIYFDQFQITIRRNLHAFIAQVLSEKRQDWYFIDALCINQNNDLEKASQVQQMGEIYRRAEEVFTWIIHEPWHYDDEMKVVYEPPGPANEAISSMSRAQIESAVLENSYWSRLWILQEVLLAKRVTIRIGFAEVEWLNLLPEKSFFERRGLPTKNNNLNICQTDTGPLENKRTALNILSYRRYQTKSLRAGKCLPFHRAFDFFAMQRCERKHDRVFGYIGLTNSRIEVDYSITVLDLFVATLADYLLSAGFITEDLTPMRKRMQFFHTTRIAMANDLIAPLLAFNLNLFDPVVNLLFFEVAKFFAPGFEENLLDSTMASFFYNHHSGFGGKIQDAFNDSLVDEEPKFEFRYIGSLCIKLVKLTANEYKACRSKQKETIARQKALAEEDAIIIADQTGESKRYTEWLTYAQAISERIWQAFQHSGVDAEGDLGDEEWTLIA